VAERARGRLEWQTPLRLNLIFNTKLAVGMVTRPRKQTFARVNYEANLRNVKSTTLHLKYVCDGKSNDQWVWLTRTEPHYGGLRRQVAPRSIG
jgi:hypothetical protein